MRSSLLLAFVSSVALAQSIGSYSAPGISPSTSATALKFSAAAGSGANGLELAQGARFTFDGVTGTKYLSSNGTVLTVTGLNVSAPTYTSTAGSGNGYGLNGQLGGTHGMTFNGVSLLLRGNGAGASVFMGNGLIWYGIFSEAGMQLNRQTLATCNSANEGMQSVDVLSGLATGKRTKLCFCTSSGASVYVWQNVVTGTLGTTTTCGTE
jgi:hypothetical protein